MQPVSWARLYRRVGISWLLAAVVGLAGCAPGTPIAIPGTGPLVTVQTRGGMCPAGGMCDETVTLEQDGRVHSSAKPPNDLGRVSVEGMTALKAAIQAADYTALKSKPFTGECPVNFDGQELIFTFAAPGGNQRIATCEVEVDWGDPLFVAVATALGEWIALPLM